MISINCCCHLTRDHHVMLGSRVDYSHHLSLHLQWNACIVDAISFTWLLANSILLVAHHYQPTWARMPCSVNLMGQRQNEVAVGWCLVAAGQAVAHNRQACSEAFPKETAPPLYCQNCVARAAAAKLCGRCHISNAEVLKFRRIPCVVSESTRIPLLESV